MQDGETRTPAYHAGSLVLCGDPAPGRRVALSAVESALAQLNEATTGLMSAYRSFQRTTTTGDGHSLSPAEATAAAASLLTSGTRTVHAVTGRPDLLGLLSPGPLLQGLGESGAEAKILCQDVLRTEMAGRRALRGLTLAGAQVATIPSPPPPILIVDREAAIATIVEPDGHAAGALLIRDSSVAGYMAAAVDSFWLIAAPLHDEVPSDGDGLFPADRALLRLLADGLTQQETARRLQLSVRTISRRTAELKRILGAASPLQAGLEAARRGWL
jgi:DNA-binding CsgD family transcriptional regulator